MNSCSSMYVRKKICNVKNQKSDIFTGLCLRAIVVGYYDRINLVAKIFTNLPYFRSKHFVLVTHELHVQPPAQQQQISPYRHAYCIC
jgi:hypothetical protein